jgi:preprotein translocase subunit SecG
MTTFIVFIHTMVCILLVVVILMQSGRGGGLTESFASAESMFGAQTNSFMVKSTTVLSVIFFATCLGLALFSLQKEKSLMRGEAMKAQSIEEKAAGVAEETAGSESDQPMTTETIPEPEAQTTPEPNAGEPDHQNSP